MIAVVLLFSFTDFSCCKWLACDLKLTNLKINLKSIAGILPPYESRSLLKCLVVFG